MKRREYKINITVNKERINKVIIDPHYEAKHSKSISDELILALVKTLDGREFEPEKEDPPFTYFMTDQLQISGKSYKLVWLLEEGHIYIGIINAYRRSK